MKRCGLGSESDSRKPWRGRRGRQRLRRRDFCRGTRRRLPVARSHLPRDSWRSAPLPRTGWGVARRGVAVPPPASRGRSRTRRIGPGPPLWYRAPSHVARSLVRRCPEKERCGCGARGRGPPPRMPSETGNRPRAALGKEVRDIRREWDACSDPAQKSILEEQGGASRGYTGRGVYLLARLANINGEAVVAGGGGDIAGIAGIAAGPPAA